MRSRLQPCGTAPREHPGPKAAPSSTPACFGKAATGRAAAPRCTRAHVQVHMCTRAGAGAYNAYIYIYMYMHPRRRRHPTRVNRAGAQHGRWQPHVFSPEQVHGVGRVVEVLSASRVVVTRRGTSTNASSSSTTVHLQTSSGVPPNSTATHLAPFGAKAAKSDHSAQGAAVVSAAIVGAATVGMAIVSAAIVSRDCELEERRVYLL